MQNIPKNLDDPKQRERAVQMVGASLSDRLNKDRSFQRLAPANPLEYALLKIRNEIDPTPNGKYFRWIMRTYMKEGIRYWEDMGRVKTALTLFEAAKDQRKLTGVDINQVKRLSDLEDMVEPFVAVSQKELSRQERIAINNETDEIILSENARLVSPKTERASCFWGKGTKWCTAATSSENYFDQYNSDGPLYILIVDLEDGRQKKFQYQNETNELLNARDDHLDSEEMEILVEYMQKLPKSQLRTDFEKAFADELIKYGWPQSEEFKMHAVRRNGMSLRHIKNPTDEHRQTAIRTTPIVVTTLEDTTEEEWIVAAQNNGMVLEGARSKGFKVTNAVALEAVKNSGHAIMFAPEQTEEICRAAVEDSPYAISYIKNPSEEVCWEAINRIPATISYFKNPTSEMMVHVLSKRPSLLSDIKDPTIEACEEAVFHAPSAMAYVPFGLRQEVRERVKTRLEASAHTPRMG